MIKPKDDINAGVVKKQYILGRRDDNEEGVLNIGRYSPLTVLQAPMLPLMPSSPMPSLYVVNGDTANPIPWEP